MRWISLFPMAKTATLYLVPIKSYSKNIHPPFFLEWAVVSFVYSQMISLLFRKLVQYSWYINEYVDLLDLNISSAQFFKYNNNFIFLVQ
jgi:hypothetical protein